MGDQRRFFKVWISALTDPDLDNLSLEDGLSRWVRLGVYLAEHGRNGVLVVRPPSNALVLCLKSSDFMHAISLVKTFPNCTVTTVTDDGVTSYRITYRNWLKYQSDYSLDRVRKHREKKRKAAVTSVTGVQRDRRVEKSRVEKRTTTPLPPAAAPLNGSHPPLEFEQFYARYPRHVAPDAALKAWRAVTKRTTAEVLMAALELQRPEMVTRVRDKIPHPATWLNGGYWRNEPTQTAIDPYAGWPKMYDCAKCGEAHETRECTRNGG